MTADHASPPRPRMALHLLTGLLTLLAASLLSAGAPAPAAADEQAEVRFGGGHVDWGVSNRWRCYVVGTIAHGQITLADGATKVPDTLATGSLCGGDNNVGSEIARFPVREGSYDPATGALDVALGGTVHYQGHLIGDSYALDTLISDLHVSVDGSGEGRVIGDSTGLDLASGEEIAFDDVTIANFDGSELAPVTGEEGTRIGPASTFLDAEGVAIFGAYTEGEPFDPIEGLLLAGADPNPEPAAKAKVKRVRVKRLGARTTIARVRCPASAPSACALKAPRKVRLSGKGKLNRRQRKALRRGFAVKAPKLVAPGSAERVQLRIKRGQRRVLAGKRLRGKVRVAATAPGAARVAKRIGVHARVR